MVIKCQQCGLSIRTCQFQTYETEDGRRLYFHDSHEQDCWALRITFGRFLYSLYFRGR